jgi:hypothetical protein
MGLGMSSSKLILHISPTPLVSAPEKIVDCLKRYSRFKSELVLLNDYPGELKGKFSKNAIFYTQNNHDVVKGFIEKASIIHIHNFLPENFINTFKELLLLSSAKLVYQVHSPLREGPVFYDFGKYSSIDFDESLVVAQYHSRLYPCHIPVPNIINFEAGISLIEDEDIPVILFSPAHNRTGGRWNDKTCNELDATLDALQKLKLCKVIYAKGLTPYELFALRKTAHITIDEIVTGAFHQVSLEGLAAGNVVVNDADWFSCKQLQSYAEQNEEPPFLRVNKDNAYEVLLNLVTNKSKIRELQSRSYQYHIENLKPDFLINNFVDVYERVLNKL